MARPRDITGLPESKCCDECGQSFSRPRRRGYQISHADWIARRFCSSACHRDALARSNAERARAGEHPAWKGDEAGRAAGNARARAIYIDLGGCNRCDEPAEVRHHRNEDTLNNAPENIEFLCRACHTEHHRPERNRRDRQPVAA